MYRVGGPVTTQLTWFDRSGRALGSIATPEHSDLANPSVVARRPSGGVQPHAARQHRHLAGRGRATHEIDVGPRYRPISNLVSSRRSNHLRHDAQRRAKHLPEALPGRRWRRAAARRTSTAEIPFRCVSRRAVLAVLQRRSHDSDRHLGLATQGRGEPFPFLNTSFAEVWGQFSPDGRWIAYQSNESGLWEIYVRPFPGPGGQWLISTTGGVYPRWASDGKELYYIDPTGRLMAVTIGVKSDALEVGKPIALFQTHILGGGANMIGRNQQVRRRARRSVPD